ncbi:MAG: PQQ-binding-like beta-propeller repeat protein [Candidatus Saccharicenans sp.]|jgi:peptidoglycan/xylan/chitin deacetylase (PgdA/CDA1 family)/outer membrane protein assembly factor BamB|nr:PQQ-binding-like beta-propeller repeat protein [Candidatus Saccharicenans sp.]MDH7575100.1 PQQ-binding-like beta-propeller repeat protein [Candidatus Saccharicenans sp.]
MIKLISRDVFRKIRILLLPALLAFLSGLILAQDLTYVQGGVVRGPVDGKRVALVFTADSYGEGGEYILAELERKGIKASFFLTGNFLRRPEFRSLVEAMVSNGHYVGPHSDRHLLYCDWQDRQKTLVTREEFLADLEANYEELARFGIDRSRARYFMPPYEWYNQEIADWAAAAGAVIVNFTPGLMTNADYTTPDMPNYRSSEKIYRQLLDYEASSASGLNGFIILVHLGVAPDRTDLFYFWLGQLVDDLRERGYSPVRIDELLSAGTAEKENGGLSPVAVGDPEIAGQDRLEAVSEVSQSDQKDKVSAGEAARPQKAGQKDDVPGGQPRAQKTSDIVSEIPNFPLTRAWVGWNRGRMPGLAASGNRVLAVFDSFERLDLRLVDLESGQNLNSFSLPQAEKAKLLAVQGGFWLVCGHGVYFIEAETGKAGDSSFELKAAPLAVSLSDAGTLILLFRKKLEGRNPKTGELLWGQDLPAQATGPAAASASEMMVALISGEISGFDLRTGRQISRLNLREEITGIQADSRNRLYLATASGQLVCFDLAKRKICWKLKLAGQRLDFLLDNGRYLYALTPGGILYKLKKSGGDILWWQTVPARSSFSPAIFGEEIIIPAGQVLYGFNLKTGRKSSETVLSFEIKADPNVAGNLLVVGAYDYRQDLSLVYALKKEPRIIIRPSKESPQPAGRRVVFSVLADGWEKPRYEFYLRQGGGPERRVRKDSSENTWTWLPAEPGEYTIGVRVFDKRLSKKAEISYNITSFAGD